jgi:hypothetical protein
MAAKRINLKIDPSTGDLVNERKITSLLSEVNGSAGRHTASIYDVVTAKKMADEKLGGLIPKKISCGAKCEVTTGGEAMPNIYKYPRIVTKFTLERTRTEWVLLTGTVQRGKINCYESGSVTLRLTPGQDAVAVARFRSTHYQVEAAKIEVSA